MPIFAPRKCTTFVRIPKPMIQFLPESRRRIKVIQVVWITIGWGMVGALEAWSTQALFSSSFVTPAAAFDPQRYLIVNILTWLLAGLISGVTLIFFLRERLRARSFGVALILNSVVLTIINFSVSGLAFTVFLRLDQGAFNPLLPWANPGALLSRPYYLRTLFLLYLVSAL
jgi:hypothetical protein